MQLTNYVGWNYRCWLVAMSINCGFLLTPLGITFTITYEGATAVACHISTTDVCLAGAFEWAIGIFLLNQMKNWLPGHSMVKAFSWVILKISSEREMMIETCFILVTNKPQNISFIFLPNYIKMALYTLMNTRLNNQLSMVRIVFLPPLLSLIIIFVKT